MTWFNKNKGRKWMRQLHRDIGLLMIGVALVYGLSGILLNHMNGKNPSYSTTQKQLTLAKGLNGQLLKEAWQVVPDVPSIQQIGRLDEEHLRLLFDGGIGVYNAATGFTEYELHEKRWLNYYINKLHYNKLSGWTAVADIFAGALIFLAVSGILMLPLKGKKGRRRGVLLVLGLLIPIIFIVLS
ncbi:MAG: PepSY-associated TM helix domain-containing protein [Marinilabiliaceae bacterium]|nr:PepSY-associated TM helix domain-containing protein [Marinilabiliaceae bacterium]